MQDIREPKWMTAPIARQLPTGLGHEFDEFIAALLILEHSGEMTTGQLVQNVLSLWSEKKQASGRINRQRLFGRTVEAEPPAAWAVEPTIALAANRIRDLDVITIRDRRIDLHQLFTSIDLRDHSETDTGGSLPDEGGRAHDIATFYALISEPVTADEQPLNAEELVKIFDDRLSRERMTAIADAYLLPSTKSSSLSETLYNYYTGKDGLIEKRFTAFARAAGFGKMDKQSFSGNTDEFRSNQLANIRRTALEAGLNGPAKARFEAMIHEGDGGAAMKTLSSTISDVYSKFVDRVGIEVNLELLRPAILSWNRLEPRPRTNNFRRVLRAEIRDALWMLSRQWQMGEFAAEDAGTSVEMRIDTGCTQISKYSLHRGPAHDIEPSMPLEATVEREPVEPDLTLRIEMGRHWLNILRNTLESDTTPLSAGEISTAIQAFNTNLSLQFTLPVPAASFPEVYADPKMKQWYAAIGNGRALDGAALHKALTSGTAADSFLIAPAAALKAAVNRAADSFTNWFTSIYSQPVGGETAWDPSHLEYQFHCSAAAMDGSVTVLSADEYASGHMDWYNFDIESDSTVHAADLRSGLPTDTVERRILTLLPGDIQFPGMPKPRWWQFEDYKVDLGGIRADTTEPAKLLLAEFALMYSNDWMLLPFGANVGSICSITSVVVKDVFGHYTRVRPAGAGNELDWQRWSMFNLSRRHYGGREADTRLFVPPVTVKVMESDPVESVNFLRDEMANMVWGIESIIPDGRGAGREGWDAGQKLFNYLVSITPPPVTTAPVSNDAAVEYQLGTEVPEHWIPFIPVRIDSVTSREIQLRRAAMPRIIPGRALERVRPRTELLRTGYDAATNTWNAYNLFEEEVLRSGCIVDRNWQRTRWTDGSVITWLGRRKYTGRGEADSGLEFDIIRNKDINNAP